MCSVYPFLSKYTWSSHTGQLYILLFGQGLWFGDRIDRLLINPNKCRSYGISLFDDTTDPHSPLGFQINTLNTPLLMEGTISTISTRCSYLEDLESCQYIYLSDQESRYPLNVNFKIMLMEEELRHRIDSRSIFDITM